MVVFIERVSEQSDWRGETAGFMDHSSPPDISRTEPNRADLSQDAMRSIAASPRNAPGDQRLALLSRIVAREILPRLAQARRTDAGDRQPVRNRQTTTMVDTGELVRLLLADGPSDGNAFIETLLLRGATPEALYIGILSDAARWLGLMWEDDRCDFAQVTIGLGRLQQAARLLSPRFQGASVTRGDGRCLLLLPAPGEQHTFGLLILGEFFQRAGWRVAGGPNARGANSGGTDAEGLARTTWFDVAGFSIGSERLLDDLAAIIRRVRLASRNRAIGVMVGGPLFQQRPDLVARAGADAMAMDAPGAVRLAGEMAARQTPRDEQRSERAQRAHTQTGP